MARAQPDATEIHAHLQKLLDQALGGSGKVFVVILGEEPYILERMDVEEGLVVKLLYRAPGAPSGQDDLYGTSLAGFNEEYEMEPGVQLTSYGAIGVDQDGEDIEVRYEPTGNFGRARRIP